eukprot:7364826-Prymnesium_polylepis.1
MVLDVFGLEKVERPLLELLVRSDVTNRAQIEKACKQLPVTQDHLVRRQCLTLVAAPAPLPFKESTS